MERGGSNKKAIGPERASVKLARFRWAAHDPEKWLPVFGKNHAAS
jgi:hypothetical protein